MPRSLGRTAPLVHTILVALDHVWTPWLAPSRILAVLPLAYITLRARSILPASVAHITLNVIDVIVMLAVVALTAQHGYLPAASPTDPSRPR